MFSIVSIGMLGRSALLNKVNNLKLQKQKTAMFAAANILPNPIINRVRLYSCNLMQPFKQQKHLLCGIDYTALCYTKMDETKLNRF
jgi:hypothetical protein